MGCTASHAESDAVAVAIRTLRAEPRTAEISRITTGGIVNAAWVKSSRQLQAILAGVKFRHHHKFLWRALEAAQARMADERAFILANAERVMSTPEWEAAPESDRRVFLLMVAVGTADDESGGPNVLASHRVTAGALHREFGDKGCFKTMANAVERIAKLGWLSVEHGKAGFGTRARATRYHLLKEASYTSPKGEKIAEWPCVSEGWLRSMAPLLGRLRAAFRDAIGYIRWLKSLPEYRGRHIPWEECFPAPSQPFDDSAAFDLLAGYEELST